MTHQTLSSSDIPPPPDPLPVNLQKHSAFLCGHRHILLHQKTFMVKTHTDMLWQVNDLDKATLFRIMLKILVKFYQKSPKCVSSHILRCVNTNCQLEVINIGSRHHIEMDNHH